MSKKDFSKGIDAFFVRGNKENENPSKRSAQAISEEKKKIEKRSTFILEADLIEKLKALAYWERTTSKTILKQSLEGFFHSKGQDYINKALEKYRVSHLGID